MRGKAGVNLTAAFQHSRILIGSGGICAGMKVPRGLHARSLRSSGLLLFLKLPFALEAVAQECSR